MPLRRSAQPTALVPSKGYGALHVDVDVGSRRAVYAADATQTTKPDAPREVRVRLHDGEGTSEPLVLAGADGHASNAAVAVDPATGTTAVLYRSAGDLFLAWLACDV